MGSGVGAAGEFWDLAVVVNGMLNDRFRQEADITSPKSENGSYSQFTFRKKHEMTGSSVVKLRVVYFGFEAFEQSSDRSNVIDHSMVYKHNQIFETKSGIFR